MNHHASDNVPGPKSTRVVKTYMSDLLKQFEPYLTYRLYPAGKRFSFSSANQQVCYFIRTGVIALYRQPDDVLIELTEAPSLRGIIPVPEGSQSQFTMRMVSQAEIAMLDSVRFYEILTEKQLWETFARHLQAMQGMTIEVIFKLISPTVFDMIRFQLYELMEKPVEIREAITA
ncbi:hypothetical protein ACED16_22440 [Enterobacter hormaechei]